MIRLIRRKEDNNMDDFIRQYEDSFFSKEFCNDRDKVESRIHKDFLEYGCSGEIYDKEKEVEYLTNLVLDRPIEISKFKVENLSEDVILAHYETHHLDTGKVFLCSSIWKMVGTDWKLYFHQGTRLIED